jgi:hypothetical protein
VIVVARIFPNHFCQPWFPSWEPRLFSFCRYSLRSFLMSHAELERELAAATGEDLRTIRRRGFQLVTPLVVFDHEPDSLESQVYDWDSQEARPLRLVA